MDKAAVLAVLCTHAQSEAYNTTMSVFRALRRLYRVVGGSNYGFLMETGLGSVLGYWPS